MKLYLNQYKPLVLPQKHGQVVKYFLCFVKNAEIVKNQFLNLSVLVDKYG